MLVNQISKHNSKNKQTNNKHKPNSASFVFFDFKYLIFENIKEGPRCSSVVEYLLGFHEALLHSLDKRTHARTHTLGRGGIQFGRSSLLKAHTLSLAVCKETHHIYTLRLSGSHSLSSSTVWRSLLIQVPGPPYTARTPSYCLYSVRRQNSRFSIAQRVRHPALTGGCRSQKL